MANHLKLLCLAGLGAVCAEVLTLSSPRRATRHLRTRQHGLQDEPPNIPSSGIEHILIAPQRKLAFCWIEKNAGTEINSFFNVLNNLTDIGGSRNSFQWQVPWSQSSLNMLGRSLGLDRNSLSRENGWRWAVLLRNPLERYLSAFLSKCVHKEEDGAHCAPFKNCVDEGPWRGLCDTAFVNASQEVLVTSFQSAVAFSSYDPASLLQDDHWGRQVDFCGGLTGGIQNYDFIGVINADVNQQMHDIISASPMVTPGDPNDEEKAYALVDALFPKGETSDASNGHASFANNEMKSFFKSPEIRRSIESLYAADFKLLNEADNM